ncbi:MAG: single-stranded DNA-binding protein [Candidatus Pacebacteria bacterium]|nr:single-stranded DNA-binding protein [Candidatus Paceibacterota bacterium]
MYINKAIVYGNLTRDPELKSLPSGMQVATFSLATNRVFKDRDGKKQEQAEFHNIVVFGRQAETVSQYLKKGNTAFVEGRMQTRSWEQEGQKKYRTEIVADRVQFGPKGSGAPSGGSAGAPRGGAADEQPNPPAGIDYPAEEINPDDIPF